MIVTAVLSVTVVLHAINFHKRLYVLVYEVLEIRSENKIQTRHKSQIN